MNTSIGNRPLSLAAHLRRTADLIRSGGVTYNWSDALSCNCGLLIRSITGLSTRDLSTAAAPYRVVSNRSQYGTWRERVATFCPLNPDLDAPAFFKRLFDAGLRPEDFGHLEYLSHPDLHETRKSWFGKMRTVKPDHRDGADVAAYCDRWAAKIEAFNAGILSTSDMEAIETRPLIGT